jgi:IS1 family transposase
MREAQLKLCSEYTREVLGCLVSIKGIEANLDKIKAIMHMKPLQLWKDVQKLTGRIASLEWGPEQQKTFDDLKAYLQQLAVLSSLTQGNHLYYMSLYHTQQ